VFGQDTHDDGETAATSGVAGTTWGSSRSTLVILSALSCQLLRKTALYPQSIPDVL
jgi:hypothetical protein